LTGDAGRGCGDASRALLFVKNAQNTMSCMARPAIGRQHAATTQNKKSGTP